MKKIFAAFIAAALLCGPAAAEKSPGGKILIAYFSWADNAVVTDPDASVAAILSHYRSIGDNSAYAGTDAVSTASVIAPGNTAQLAGLIRERTGGDLFAITTEEPYSAIYDECYERVAAERASRTHPKLKGRVENIGEYDTVFLGFPNWGYGAPMAIFSFIDENDLSGKTIIPFGSHGTGGFRGSARDMASALPESAKTLQPLGVFRADMKTARSAVEKWLDELGFPKKSSSNL